MVAKLHLEDHCVPVTYIYKGNLVSNEVLFIGANDDLHMGRGLMVSLCFSHGRPRIEKEINSQRVTRSESMRHLAKDEGVLDSAQLSASRVNVAGVGSFT